MLILSQFRQSGRWATAEEADEFRSLFDPVSRNPKFRVYEGGLFMEALPVGTYALVLGNSLYRGARVDLEANMYFEFYVSECVDDPTEDDLTRLLSEWAEWKGIPIASADEMLADWLNANPDPRERDQSVDLWLDWFINAWDRASDRAAARRIAAIGGVAHKTERKG